eukprot:TRINITY_DN1421_c1_g2_i1.p1 TRINITY_DN1421_c1_g2~~TRINITY_DN1421_c1_g2_i1.p1  ORF type:complete len:568 (+),score=28.44 TRINITY_DN1421_c1_g2_i1:1455-3158(+)
MVACAYDRRALDVDEADKWWGSGYGVEEQAVPGDQVLAANIALPRKAGRVNLTDVLPAEIVEAYHSGSIIREAPAPVDAHVRPRLGMRRNEYKVLLRRMQEAGMVRFAEPAEVRATNGLFCVRKGDGALRLILDARPGNRWLHPPPNPELPRPECLAALELPSERDFFTGKMDLSNFYHSLQLPAVLQPFFALPWIWSAECGLVGPNRLVAPVPLTVPMGLSHAVFLGQSVHVHVLIRAPSSPFRILGVYANGRALVVSWHAFFFIIYIDDLMIGSLNRELVMEAMRYAQRAYEEAQFVVKQEKSVWPLERPRAIVFMGTELTAAGLLLPTADRLRSLCARTRTVCSQEVIPRRVLEHVVGGWVWVLLIRRPLLSALWHVYRITSHGPLIVVSAELRAELERLIKLVPCIQLDLKAKWAPILVATDASMTGGGLVYAEAEPPVVRAASVWQGSDFTSPPFVQLTWHIAVANPWNWRAHINVLELEEVVLALRWLACRHSAPGRYTCLIDSTVALGALNKGRSNSFAINTCLRRAAVPIVLSGLQPAAVYIPTDVNPADAPSRRHQAL